MDRLDHWAAGTGRTAQSAPSAQARPPSQPAIGPCSKGRRRL